MEIKLASLGGLWCCAYRSTQAKRMTRADIAALLRESQMRNVNRHVTGLLLRVDDRFLQYFEGPQAAVTELWSHILSDGRHKDPQCRYMAPTPQRLFAHWTMAFNDLSGQPMRLGPENGLLQRVLREDPPPDGQGQEDDIFHRFWADCAASLPR